MLAITSNSFQGYSLDHIFELTAAAGLEGIEVAITHGEFDTQDAEYLKKLSKRHNLPIVALSTPINMNAVKAERALNLATEIGAPLLSLTPPDIFNFNYRTWLKKEFATLRRRKKVQVALVNPPIQTLLGIIPKYAFNDFHDLKEFADITFDVCNTRGHSEPLLEIYSILKSNIRHIYLANAKHEKNYTLLPDGNLPLESFLTRLARDNFDKAIVLKLDPKTLGVGKIDKVLKNLENCQEFVRKYFVKN
jgi:sugar phosphate isomerase/epimerase